MPYSAKDYSKTYFYKIVCNDLNIKDSYIGHTTNFTSRKSRHKHNCYDTLGTEYNYKVYQFIRDHGGWNNWQMVLIEECACKNSYDASAKERSYYEQLKPTLNIHIPNNFVDVERITCECGRKYTMNNKQNHLKSKIHKNFLLTNNNGNQIATCQEIQ